MSSGEAIATLKKVFPNLPPEAIEGLYQSGKVAEYPDKTVLCHEGQRENTFYIIIEGSVAITKTSSSGSQMIASKRSGEFFGEAALLSDEPRTANVVAEGPIRVIQIEREAFHAYMLKNAAMGLALTQLTVKQLNTQQLKLDEILVELKRAHRRPRIFVSYAHENREFATKLVNDLIAEGLNVWMDHLHIPPGIDWDDAIDDALNTCDKMLLLLSKDSLNSENVKSEWKYYLNTVKRPIVPVRYEKVQIPYRRLATMQYVDFVDTPYDAALKHLITTLVGKEKSSKGDAKSEQGAAAVPYRHP